MFGGNFFMKKGYVKCGAAEIYYEIYGSGIPIVFLHGNGEDMTYFKYQKEALKDKYKLVFIDSRGHGKSTFGSEKLTLDLMSNDVIHVLEELNLDEVNLVGFSDGGNLGIIMALKKPSLFKRMILVGANLKPEDLILSERIQIDKEIKLEEDYRKKEILELMVNEPNIEDIELSKIDIPTLVMAGEDDLITKECTVRIAHNLRNSKLMIISGGDHFFIDKKPDIFNDALIEFINIS